MHLAERFWAHVDRRGPDECWPWTASVDASGYGQIEERGPGLPRSKWGAHRLALVLAGVELPRGLVVDHECHNRDASCPGGTTCPHRRCCNPAHLRPTTRRQNNLSGRGFAAANARKTHCKRGHEFTPANTGLQYRRGFAPQRYCRTCSLAKLAAIHSPGRRTTP